eukprot:gene14574-19569_t
MSMIQFKVNTGVIAMISTILSFIYFLVPGPITKVLVCIALAFLVYVHQSNNNDLNLQLFISAGLWISSIGDFFLEIEYSNIDLFIPGLLSFLTAHIAYIIAFNSEKVSVSSVYSLVIGGVVSFYFFSMMIILLPAVETFLIVPVIIYGGVISTMTYCAINRCFAKRSSTSWFSLLSAAIGSLFFVASDTILAIDKFAKHIPINNAKTIVMITYYIGQTLIAISAVSPLDLTKKVG